MSRGIFTAAVAVVVVVVILLLASTCGSDKDDKTRDSAPPSPGRTTPGGEQGRRVPTPSTDPKPDDEDSQAVELEWRGDQTGDDAPTGVAPSSTDANHDDGGPMNPGSDSSPSGSSGGPGKGGSAGLPGPPYTTPVKVLDRALECTPGARGRKTAVLVQGTGMTADETWGWGYERALPRVGFAVCTVEFAGRSLVSIFNQADYMVYAIRKARRLSGQKVSVIGHSQGGSHPLWAMKFWPDVRDAVDDYIGIAPGVNGARVGDVACVTGSCAALAWQVRFGSKYLTRLHEGGLPVGPSYTNIYTEFDEVAYPQPEASHIPGGSNVSVQSVCPARVVEHGTILGDSVAWALTVDALRHPGPADPSRLTNRLALCIHPFMPEIDLVGMTAGLTSGLGHAATGLAAQPQVDEEPPLPDYAD